MAKADDPSSTPTAVGELGGAACLPAATSAASCFSLKQGITETQARPEFRA